MKKLLLVATLIIGATACSHQNYYQMFSVASPNAQMTNNGSPLYVEDGLEFTYNFWGEGGVLRFIVYNSNDYDVIVDMTKSSFIRNNIAEDYYQGREWETRFATSVSVSSQEGVAISVNKQVGVGKMVSYLGNGYDQALALSASTTASTEYGTTGTREWQTAIVQKEPEFVRIPAKSAKAFGTFNINNVRLTGAEYRVKNYYQPVEYTEETTPMFMTNRICAYQEGGEPKFYNMNFYISGIGNVTKLSNGVKPTSFYITYSSLYEPTYDSPSDYTSLKKKKESLYNVGDVVVLEGEEVIVCGIVSDNVVAVAKRDSLRGTWNDGIAYCQELGEEWRLPMSVSECMKLKRAFEAVGIETMCDFWTGAEVSESRAECFEPNSHRMGRSSKTNEHSIVVIKEVNVFNITQ